MTHPILPAGYNADPIDGFEVNSPGTNAAVWPVLYDTFIGLETIIITEEMMEWFDTSCPDYVAPYEDITAEIRFSERVYEVPAYGWPELTIDAVNSTYVIPSDTREQEITGDWNDGVVIAAVNDDLPVPRGVRTQQMRKRA